MTFDGREGSVAAGAPVELYEFTRGSSVWRYTSADVAQVYLTNTYTTSLVRRGGWQRSPNAEQAGTVQFFAPWDHPIVQEFVLGSPHATMALKVFVRHRDDAEFLTAFIGLITNVAVEGAEAELTARNLEGRLTRRVPRMLISRTCPFMLYDTQCNVDETAFDFSGTVSAISGHDVTVTGLGTFAGADLAYFVDGVLTKAGIPIGFIEAQAGDVVTTLERPRGLAVSDTVVVYAGCDRTMETCRTKFANASRFGGHHAIPKYNPFDGLIGLKESGI